MVKDGLIINHLADLDSYAAEENDNDAAVNFALKRNKSGAKENHSIKELILSANSLPGPIKGKPNTFAAIYVNLYSLDEHDKMALGKLS